MGEKQRDRKRWEPPTLTFVGLVGDILQSGGGKLEISLADTGEEHRKPQGQE